MGRKEERGFARAVGYDVEAGFSFVRGDCIICDREHTSCYWDLICTWCNAVGRIFTTSYGTCATKWLRKQYMEDLDDTLQALRLLPQPIWEEIEPEFTIPFKAWRESKLSTAPKNTDGTTPTLLQLWLESVESEAVPTVAPFAEIQTILTPSAGAECSAEGARSFTPPPLTSQPCTRRFY